MAALDRCFWMAGWSQSGFGALDLSLLIVYVYMIYGVHRSGRLEPRSKVWSALEPSEKRGFPERTGSSQHKERMGTLFVGFRSVLYSVQVSERAPESSSFVGCRGAPYNPSCG
ncbi:unnamed protein product [Ectocarpus sp. 12 AP-2014]